MPSLKKPIIRIHDRFTGLGPDCVVVPSESDARPFSKRPFRKGNFNELERPDLDFRLEPRDSTFWETKGKVDRPP